MGGLAIGNAVIARLGRRVRRPVALYAGLECAIGLAGISLVYLLPMLSPLLAPVLGALVEVPVLANLVRLGSAFLLLLLPSSAMGATLPLLVAALNRGRENFGQALGLLYGWNTLGAVVGVVMSEAIFVESFGIRATAWLAGAVSLAAAALAAAASRHLEFESSSTIEPRTSRPLPRSALGLLAAAFMLGACLLGLEVIWFRFLVLFVHGTALTFAIMLGVVLLGIGLGGLVGSRWIALNADARGYGAILTLLCGAVVTVTYAGFSFVLEARPPGNEYGFAALYYGLPLMFPVSLLSGALFTFLGDAIERAAPDETRSAGLLTLANTIGAMLGSLLAGFVLLPSLGIEASIWLLALGYGVAAPLLWFGGLRPSGRPGRRMTSVALVLFAISLLAFPNGRLGKDYLRYPIERLNENGQFEVVEVRESLTETIIYLRRSRFEQTLYYKMGTNSSNMSATSTLAQRYMKLFVYLPFALHPEPKDALLISYGVGMTAKALTETESLERIDIVDISRDILDMNQIVYPESGTMPRDDPRVRVHIEDGRHFLQTTDRRFDLITGEPPPPKMAGVISLFTQQFFQLAHDRLNLDGLISYWLPVHDLTVPERDAIISAFCSVFDDCTLWSGAKFDWILLGSRGGLPPVDSAQFSAQWEDPVVASRLAAIGIERPEQLGALFMLDTPALQTIRRTTRPLDDDRPGQLGREIVGIGQVGRDHRPLLHVEAGRRGFRESEFVRRHWPESIREETDAWFGERRAAHGASRVFRRFAPPGRSHARIVPIAHRDPARDECTLAARHERRRSAMRAPCRGSGE